MKEIKTGIVRGVGAIIAEKTKTITYIFKQLHNPTKRTNRLQKKGEEKDHKSERERILYLLLLAFCCVYFTFYCFIASGVQKHYRKAVQVYRGSLEVSPLELSPHKVLFYF